MMLFAVLYLDGAKALSCPLTMLTCSACIPLSGFDSKLLNMQPLNKVSMVTYIHRTQLGGCATVQLCLDCIHMTSLAQSAVC